MSVKHWWRKWTYEVPLAVGDALWEVLVVQLAALLDRLTVRKVIALIPVVILSWPTTTESRFRRS
jgi:hypothetical protein